MSILQPGKKIAICSDHAGYELKSVIEGYLLSQGIECEDFGTFSGEKRAATIPASASAAAATVSA